MAFKRAKARVAERSTTSGSGPWTLAGALDTSYQTFASFLSGGDTIEVTVVEPGVAFWTGIATFTSSGSPTNNTISPTTVEETAGTFGAGTKEIFAGHLASRSLLREDLSGLTTGGSSTAYTVSTKTVWASLTKLDGQILAIKVHTTSGATPTLAVDSLTAKNLRLQSGITCPTGAFFGGSTYLVRYDNSNNEFVALCIPNKIVADAVITASILDANVTYAKVQNVTAARLLGNPTGGAAAPSEISLVSTDLAFSGSTLKLNTTAPTVQTFTSGSGTYTTPAGVKWIEVRMVGGGAGGGGGQSSTLSTAGGNTSFGGLFTASGGGAASNGVAGAGGSASGGNIGNYPGGSGAAPTPPATAYSGWGGQGGSSYFGGGGAPSAGNATGSAGATNTGGGGGGGGATNASLTGSGAGGGGAGGTVIAIITSPSASYSYSVGAGGAGATGGSSASSAGGTGGAGAAGKVEVIEHYSN